MTHADRPNNLPQVGTFNKIGYNRLYLSGRVELSQIRAGAVIPMYRQLSSLIRQQIERGELATGDQVLSEAQLSERYGISRITVRQALSELERDGLVEKVPGKGTFVREPEPRVERLTRLSGFGENMAALGLRAGYKTLRAEEDVVPEEVTDRLRSHGKRAYVIERILLADGRPVGTHTSYLPLWIVKRAPEGAFTRWSLDQNSIYRLMEEARLKLSRAEEIVEPHLVDGKEAERLDLDEGGLALRIRRTVYDPDERPLEYVIIIYRADSYTFRVELSRDQGA
jgi:GntR family transcriptional regulator